VAVWTYPDIDPVLARFGPFVVRWYGLAYVAAFVAAYVVLHILDRRWELGIGVDDELSIVLAAIIGVVAGGRLGYVLFYGLRDYLSDPLSVFAIWDGGMSFHGGLAGILLAGVWMTRKGRLPVSFLRLCDVGAVGAPAGFLFGRLANFVNGELWGRVSAAPWAMVFPGGGPLARHPSQLYEALLEGAVLWTVVLLLARRKRPEGEMLGWLLTLYGVFRILVETVREPDPQLGFLFGGVTMGQLLSVPMVAVGLWLLVRVRREGEKDAV